MIYLLGILLVFGLIQSFLELKKDDTDQSPTWIKKGLSLLYICGFIIGVIILIIQNQEAETANKLIQNISSSVTKIDSNSIEQIQKIGKTIEKTELLVDKSKTLNEGMIEVLKMKDSLLYQYRNVNRDLERQLELDKMKLKERSPIVDLKDYDIKWVGNDSTSYSLEACIRNFGKRNATIIGGKGYAVFFDNENEIMLNILFPGNNNEGLLESNENQGMRLCYYSHALNNFQPNESKMNFCVLCLRVKYKDELLNIENEKNFYLGWSGKNNVFGGLKGWQVDLAKKWEVENYQL